MRGGLCEVTVADLAEESCVALPWRLPSGATEQPVLCSQAWRGSVGLKGSQAGGQGADAIEGSGPLQRADRTGDAIMQSEYSGAGPRPSLAPWPKRKGRMYMEPPEPYGGTKSMLSAISRSRPSSNISGLTSGMARRWQPEARRAALAPELKTRTWPSLQWCAFSPSKMPWP